MSEVSQDLLRLCLVFIQVLLRNYLGNTQDLLRCRRIYLGITQNLLRNHLGITQELPLNYLTCVMLSQNVLRFYLGNSQDLLRNYLGITQDDIAYSGINKKVSVKVPVKVPRKDLLRIQECTQYTQCTQNTSIFYRMENHPKYFPVC